jgi:hypothetical protein
MEERGVWEATIHVPDGWEHCFAVVVDSTPEAAIEAAMGRAVQRYGPQDWQRWKLRAELHTQPVTLREVHFEFRDGALRRF